MKKPERSDSSDLEGHASNPLQTATPASEQRGSSGNSATGVEQGKGLRHSGPAHAAPYPQSRMAPAMDLVDLAKQIQEADRMVSNRVGSNLRVIAKQIMNLQEQAREVLEKAQHDQALHYAQCNFKRIPGKIYHLYRRPDHGLYFSMLSPAEWNERPPHEYVDSYRLENDLSWTPIDQIDAPDEAGELVKQILHDRGLLLRSE